MRIEASRALAAYRANGHVELRGTRRRAGLLLLGSLVFVAVAFLEPPVLRYLTIVFFGLGIPIAAVQLVVPSTLVIDSQGITSRVMRRQKRYEFTDCGTFRIWRNPTARQTLVTFNHAPTMINHPKMVGVNESLGALAQTIPQTYGLGAADLAALLNEAQRIALGR